MSIKATLSKNIFDTIALDSQQALYPLLVYAAIVGLEVKREGDICVLSGITDLSLFGLTTTLGIVQSGGEVEGLPIFIEMTSDFHTDTDVPVFVPNATYIDENEQTISRKWSEWKDATHEHHTIGDKVYVPGASFGVELKGSVLAQLYGASYTLKTQPEFEAIKEAAQENP